MSYENIPYNTTVELYEENGLYFFDSLIAVKDFSLGENGLMNGAKVSFSLQSQMKFNEEYLVGITIKYSVTYDLEDGKITTAISYTSNYEKGFKESLITNDFSDYPTEIKAADFDVSYIVDGENMYIETKNYKNGQTFVVDYENNVENTYIDNWFLDKANTIGISNLEDYPSYDVTLYAVTKPNEGYGLVILKGVANYSGGWQMYLSVEREAFLANEQYVIPNVIEHWGNDMNVSNVKVNGETYTQQTITIENRSVYVIEVELTEISE